FTLKNVQITEVITNPNQVETPVISPAVSDIFEPTEISIACATEGTTIYYTVDNTDPSTASTQYSVPFTVSANTTVKAIAVKSGLSNSEVATKTYTFPTEVANIAAFLAVSGNDYYKITGAVTVVYQNGQNLYIHDATGDVLVYGTTTQTLTNGKVLTGLSGKLGTYGGSPQITNPVLPATATDGTAIVATVKNLATLTTADHATYIKAERVQFIKDVTYSTSATVNDTLVTPVGFVVRDNFRLGGSVVAGTNYDITGFVSFYNGAAQLFPVEIVVSTPAAVTTPQNVAAKIYSANGNLIVTVEQAQTIEIFNALGQKIITKNIVAGINTIPVNTRGILFVKADGKINKVYVK
ncbi:MAG: chitobiase/beta-hexosaminidase C-terminal domain-containing protein, partial [Paludibacter sp.]|nr:chitobiase/beta-hexosaminidase C-terminal domain-containing protein [Paludibacter sp.]